MVLPSRVPCQCASHGQCQADITQCANLNSRVWGKTIWHRDSQTERGTRFFDFMSACLHRPSSQRILGLERCVVPVVKYWGGGRLVKKEGYCEKGWKAVVKKQKTVEKKIISCRGPRHQLRHCVSLLDGLLYRARGGGRGSLPPFPGADEAGLSFGGGATSGPGCSTAARWTPVIMAGGGSFPGPHEHREPHEVILS